MFGRVMQGGVIHSTRNVGGDGGSPVTAAYQTRRTCSRTTAASRAPSGARDFGRSIRTSPPGSVGRRVGRSASSNARGPVQ